MAATWDGSKARIYVDGLLDNGSGTTRNAPIGTDNRPVYLGGRVGGGDRLDGSLDDVRFYDRALSGAEVRMLYDDGVGDGTARYPQLIAEYDLKEVRPTPQLIGHWKLDESGRGGGMAAADRVQVRGGARIDSYDSGAGSYGPANNAEDAIVATNSTRSSRFSMDGRSSLFGHAYCGAGGDPATVISAPPGSISGQRRAMTTNVVFPDLRRPSGMPRNRGHKMYTRDMTLRSDRAFARLTLRGCVVTVQGDVRLHCTGRFRVEGNAKIVVPPGSSLTVFARGDVELLDGSIFNTDTSGPERLTIKAYVPNTEISIEDDAQVCAVLETDGDVKIADRARFYGSIVAADDIQLKDLARAHLDVNLPNVGIGEVLAADATRTNGGFYRGQATGGQTGAVNRTGTSVRFDGSNDFVEIPHHDAYLLNSGAVGFWFRTDDRSRTQGLFSKDSAGLDSGGQLTVSIRNARVRVRMESAGGTHEISSRKIRANRWYHVLFAFGPDGMKLYLDGKIAKSNPYVGGMGTTSGGVGNDEPIALGVSTSDSADGAVSGWNDALSGLMDDVRIYDYALDAAQVANLYDGQVLGDSTLPGSVVYDSAQYGGALNLMIRDTGKIRWIDGGGLEVTAPTEIRSEGAATKLERAMANTHETTMVLAFTPPNLVQTGPASILSYGSGRRKRNFTLGQKKNRYSLRLRTSDTGGDAKPDVDSPAVLTTTGIHQVIVTFDGEQVAMYRAGLREKTEPRTGSFSTWDDQSVLVLANEFASNRPWLGSLHRVAIYDRAFNIYQVNNVFGGKPPGSGIAPNYSVLWDEQP